MDTEKYKVFLQAIDSGSLSAAAEQTGYTISGVSRMMMSLEEETGFPLLIREKRGVRPTRECEALIPIMRQLVSEQSMYQQTANDIRGLVQGNVTVGTSYLSYYGVLAETIAGFNELYPGITVTIVEGTSTELIDSMNNHKVDFCIVSRRTGEYEFIPLQKDPLVAIVPTSHPCADKKKYPVKRFAEDDFIEIYPDMETDNSQMLEANHVISNRRHSTMDNYAVYAMVSAGLGVSASNSLITTSFNGNFVVLPLDPPWDVEIGVAVPKGESLPPAARRFIEFAKSKLLK